MYYVDDLILKEIIGEGGLGTVYLSQKKDKNELFAVKKISIQEIDHSEKKNTYIMK